MEQSNEPLSVPVKNLDDIDLEERIGHGNFPVYRAKMEGKTIAVKKMDCRQNQIPREVRVQSNLPAHPSVLPLLGIAHSKDGFTINICMELADMSLYHFLHTKKERPSLQQSINWAKQIAEGMYHIHQNGLAHRDLKSANVLLFEKEGTIKVCDFGSARSLDHTATVTGGIGTYRWMAPEFSEKASAKINQRCDVFSYGMVLYEIFAQEVPFSSTTDNVALVSLIRDGERPLIPQELPLYIQVLMESCWRQNPYQRPTFEGILQVLRSTPSSKEETQDILDEKTPLHKAAESGDVIKVQQLIGNNVDVNAQTVDGKTALHLASGCGYASVVEVLIDAKANIDLQDKFRCTALYLAACNGCVEVVQLLLQHKADVNICDEDGFSSLYVASQENHIDIVDSLLKSGANPNLTCKISPLYTASRRGHSDVVDTLLKYGAKPNLTTQKSQTAPLGVAAQEGHVQIVRSLLEKEAQIDHQNKNGGYTALYWASWRGHIEVVRLLLQHHANVNVENENGTTPLYIATQEGHVQVVQLLLQSGALDTRGKTGYTAMDIAKYKGNSAIVDLLQQFSHTN